MSEISNSSDGLQKSVSKHLIDTNSFPYCPEYLAVKEHKKEGIIEYNFSSLPLYVSEKQKNGYISGNNLRIELADKPVLNANVLDYLLANPEFIPEEWKGEFVFFWGTIYQNSDGSLCVRYLKWNGRRWDSGYFWLGNSLHRHFSAVLASDFNS